MTHRKQNQMLALAERADASEGEGDSYAAPFAALLEHGSSLGLQDGHCPLCAASRSTEEFNEAMANARARLAARGERFAASSRSVADARAAVDAAAQAVTMLVLRLARAIRRSSAPMMSSPTVQALKVAQVIRSQR